MFTTFEHATHWRRKQKESDGTTCYVRFKFYEVKLVLDSRALQGFVNVVVLSFTYLLLFYFITVKDLDAVC